MNHNYKLTKLSECEYFEHEYFEYEYVVKWIFCLSIVYSTLLLFFHLGTADPYVILRVRTSPNSKQRTTTKDDEVNPEWNEDFKFYLNPEKENTLGVFRLTVHFKRLTVF